MSLRTPLAIDPIAAWEPKSGFFQHVKKRIRRPTVVQQAPSQHNARLAFCTFHNSAYLSGDEFPKSPCCNTEPLLTYDLEALTDAATVVEALVDALQATDTEDLVHRINLLAGLVRDKVAGATDELSQESSTAAGGPSPASEQDGPGTSPVASVEDPNGPEAPLSSPPATETAAEGAVAFGLPSATPAKTPRTRRQPAAVAS